MSRDGVLASAAVAAGLGRPKTSSSAICCLRCGEREEIGSFRLMSGLLKYSSTYFCGCFVRQKSFRSRHHPAAGAAVVVSSADAPAWDVASRAPDGLLHF